MIAPRILVLSTEAHGLEFIAYLVTQTFLEGKVTTTTSPADALARIQTEEYHVVLCDMDLPAAGGPVFLEDSLCLWPRPTIVPLIKDNMALPPSFEYMAFSYLRKPISFDTLSTVLLHAVEFNLLHRRVERFSRVLSLMSASQNAYGEELRQRIMEAESGMRDLWEKEHERANVGEAEPSSSDGESLLQDASFGWAVETLLIHTADKKHRTRTSPKVA